MDDLFQFAVRSCCRDILPKGVHVGMPNSVLDRRYNFLERLGGSHTKSLHLNLPRRHSPSPFRRCVPKRSHPLVLLFDGRALSTRPFVANLMVHDLHLHGIAGKVQVHYVLLHLNLNRIVRG